MLLPPQQQQHHHQQQQYQYSTRNTEFTVHMESQPHSLRRTRSPQEPMRNNNNNNHNNNMNTAVAAVSDATLEEERLQSVLHQLNEKQVPPTSHHGLTILITGANRYVASSKHRRNTHPSATHNIISFSLSLPSSDL